jgi:LAO/AO transport system kinase
MDLSLLQTKELRRCSGLNKNNGEISYLSPTELDTMKSGVKKGDRKLLARAISLCEDSPFAAARILSYFGAYGKQPAVRIGLTGPPGAGKSSLVSKLITSFVQADKKIGAVLVDPTSPISKGAVLGDRIRLGDESLNENVYTRSLASRGSLGGLSVSASAAVRLIELWGARDIIIETVGIGQQGTDVQWLADVVLLVLSPGIGDSIQAMKAGVFETADAFIINKSDLPGAHNLALMIETELISVNGSQPRVFMTNARTGEGVVDLIGWIREFVALQSTDAQIEIARKRVYREMFFLTESLIIDRLTHDSAIVSAMQKLTYKVIDDDIDVFSAAIKIYEMVHG